MTIEELFQQAREYDMLVISPTEVWPSPWVTTEVIGALLEHQDEVNRRLALGDASLCPNPSLHSRSWVSIGRGRQLCRICEDLYPEVCGRRAV